MNLPPCDLEAEAACLSGILFCDGFDLVSDQTRPEHYFADKNAKILEACFDVAKCGARPDAVTVGAWLRDRALGDFADAIDSLRGKCQDIANIGTYAELVKHKCLLRRAISCGERTATEAHALPADVMAWLSERERAMFELSHDIKRDIGQSMADVMTDVFTNLKAIEDGTRSADGASTGLVDFDKVTTGLHGGELFVVAARPGMGKTSLATQIADHLSGHEQKGVILFSLEMPREQLALRLVAAESNVDLRMLRAAKLTADEWDRVTAAAVRLKRDSLWIDDSSGLTPLDMLSRVRRRAAEWSRNGIKLGLVIVDYIQLMTSGANKRGENRQEEVAYISRSLKQLAREMNIPVIALAQLNRNVERKDDRRPQLSDLRESGAIEQDADCVCMIYREDYYNKMAGPTVAGKAELIVCKQRNGPTGTLILSWDGHCTRFGNVPREAADMYRAATSPKTKAG